MKCKQTQKRQVLALLKRGWTTVGQCYHTLGFYTLSQRVSELKRGGHKIVSRPVPGKRYDEYRAVR